MLCISIGIDRPSCLAAKLMTLGNYQRYGQQLQVLRANSPGASLFRRLARESLVLQIPVLGTVMRVLVMDGPVPSWLMIEVHSGQESTFNSSPQKLLLMLISSPITNDTG